MLDINDKNCVVIGGGSVAFRKITSLLEYGAKVKVISKEICDNIKKLADQEKIEVMLREYRQGDLKGAYLAFILTDSIEVNSRVYKEAALNQIPANIANIPEMCDFILPSKINRGDFTIAISTNGKSPMLAKKIRQNLEEEFGEEYSDFLELMGEIREKSLKKIPNEHSRESLYKELIYSDLIEELKKGNKEQVRDSINKIFQSFIQVTDKSQ